LVINKEGIDTILYKKFDGDELPLTTTREQIPIVHADRFI
jgi:hypothetical protein